MALFKRMGPTIVQGIRTRRTINDLTLKKARKYLLFLAAKASWDGETKSEAS